MSGNQLKGEIRKKNEIKEIYIYINQLTRVNTSENLSKRIVQVLVNNSREQQSNQATKFKRLDSRIGYSIALSINNHDEKFQMEQKWWRRSNYKNKNKKIFVPRRKDRVNAIAKYLDGIG